MCYTPTKIDGYTIFCRKRFIEDDEYLDEDNDIIAYDKSGNKLSNDEISELFAKYNGVIELNY
jgi:hypothetical protein